jgi:thiol:disulfide interchange protein
MKMSAAALVLAGVFVFAAAAFFARSGSESGGSYGVGHVSSSPTASSAYREYSPEAVSSASDGDKIVLFFHAQWCVTCKLLADDISANTDRIPQDVRILVADFDSETALKQDYGVTLQHTLVQVTRDAGMVGKWSSSRSLDDLLSRIS